MATAKASQHQEQQVHGWDDWFHAQKDFLNGQMQKQWGELLTVWQGILSGGPGAQGGIPGADVYQKFFTQAGQQFLGLMQKFQDDVGMGASPDKTAKAWADGLQQLFSGLMPSQANTFDPASMQQSFTQFSESMAKAGKAWGASLAQGGPFAQNPQGLGALDPFGFLASLPGIGYTREKQEEMSELYRRYTAFTRATEKYNAGMNKVGVEATRKFQDYIMHPPEGAPPLTSLKAIYVKWVDICEDVYAKYAMSDEYTETYGATVNALMEFKLQMQRISDEILTDLNIPTRKEVDELHERQHALRRENRQLKKDVAELKKAVLGTTPTTGKKN